MNRGFLERLIAQNALGFHYTWPRFSTVIRDFITPEWLPDFQWTQTTISIVYLPQLDLCT